MKIEKRRILKFKEKDRKKKRAIGKNEEIFNKTNTSLFELLMSKNLIPNQSLITKISNCRETSPFQRHGPQQWEVEQENGEPRRLKTHK